MTPTQLNGVMALVDLIWPGRFEALHSEALRNQFKVIDIDTEAAKIVLQQVWATKNGKYAAPQAMIDALKSASRKNRSTDPAVAAQEKAARFADENRRADEYAYETMLWLDRVSDADLERVRTLATKSFGSYFTLGGTSRDYLRTHEFARCAMHTVARHELPAIT